MKTAWQWFLAFGMLITGSANTIVTKMADNVKTEGAPDSDPRVHNFSHPFVQALGMFAGEALCLGAFAVLVGTDRRKQIQVAKLAGTPQQELRRIKSRFDHAKPFNRLLLAMPASLDMCGTSTIYAGLVLTYASVFQMLRGSVVIFTGLASVIFLKRKLLGFHWLGMVLVLVGTAIVGISSIGGDTNASAPNPAVGNILVVAAQVIVAIQMCLEEYLITGYKIPALQVVGWEGCWGFCILSCVLVGMYYIPMTTDADHPTGRFEDAVDAAWQLSTSKWLVLAIGGNMLSIAFFNWFGISITSEMSAAHRMVLDSVRTLVVWGYDLIFAGQAFSWLQLAGFVVLLFGTVVYNELVHVPGFVYPTDDEASKKLLSVSGEEDEEEGERERQPSGAETTADMLITPTLQKKTFAGKR